MPVLLSIEIAPLRLLISSCESSSSSKKKWKLPRGGSDTLEIRSRYENRRDNALGISYAIYASNKGEKGKERMSN